MKFIVAVLLFLTLANADLYMQNPRGSNDRLNEANTDRNNANRLFDSQNNAKGGYCWGPALSLYEGSLLSVQWTNQHGCGGQNDKLVCNMVLQYMCSNADAADTDLVRDGTTTNTITANDAGATTKDANGNLLYGMHENYAHYTACTTRSRNMGLFIADRNLGGNSAIYTRQNNNGNRFGYECTEERDYYPYWAPSPWVDIAVMAQDTKACDFYKAESFNVKSRFICVDANGVQAKPNNQVECGSQSLTWTEVKALGVPAPDCIQSQASRDNHLGNGLNGQANSYNWTLPTSSVLPCIKDNNCACALRIRYNISTGDLGTDGNRPDAGFIDWTSNQKNSPVEQDPTVLAAGYNFTLAIDTSQFGRTFQDRSHTFGIKARPSGVTSSNRIFNLNVRGKRGNIVQTYPATEYDFVPDNLELRVGDLIHFQWTGCDTNPAGNAGEGTDQTDRSNIVQVADLHNSLPASDDWITSNGALFESSELRGNMANLGQTDCLSYEELLANNNNNQGAVEDDVRNCMKLNAASQYFDGGIVKVNNTGSFFYMNTRNNNFSNRGQKGTISVIPLLPTWALAVVIIGAVAFVLAGGVAGMMVYAKSHPHSPIAEAFSKM